MVMTIDNAIEKQAFAEAKTPPGVPRAATVLQVLPALGNQGGVERGTVEIAAAIVAAGGRALVASAGGPMEFELRKVGGEHFTLPLDTKNPFRIRANAGTLATLIEKEGVDLIHARSRAPAWSAFWASGKTKRPFVTTFHGTYNFGGPLKRWYNSIMSRGERVIAISSFIAGHLRQFYGTPNRKIRVIHRGVNLRRFDPAAVSARRMVALANDWRLGDGLPVIMLPGRLTHWKGQEVFLEAAAKLGRRDVRYLLVGSAQGREGYLKRLESMTRRLALSDVVRIIDHCGDMPAAYMLADVVVSASTDPEAFGRVVAEAQALGRPVVVSDHGGPREQVVEGETGWLVKPGDPAALAEGMAKALDLTFEERQALAAKAIRNVRENFSKDVMCAKTLDVYNEVLDIESH